MIREKDLEKELTQQLRYYLVAPSGDYGFILSQRKDADEAGQKVIDGCADLIRRSAEAGDKKRNLSFGGGNLEMLLELPKYVSDASTFKGDYAKNVVPAVCKLMKFRAIANLADAMYMFWHRYRDDLNVVADELQSDELRRKVIEPLQAMDGHWNNLAMVQHRIKNGRLPISEMYGVLEGVATESFHSDLPTRKLLRVQRHLDGAMFHFSQIPRLRIEQYNYVAELEAKSAAKG